MACNGCTKKFGVFAKENGCPLCKLSFCSKCLKYRMNKDGRTKDVCLRCYESTKIVLSACKETNTSKSILDAPIDITKLKVPDIKPANICSSNTLNDKVIQQRLAALKQDENEPSDSSTSKGSLSDIEQRLASLKGIEYKDYDKANKSHLLQKEQRSEQQQITDLLKRFSEEQAIHDAVTDCQLASIDEIENRLAVLRDIPPSLGAKRSEEENDYDDDEAAKHLAQRFLEEAALDVNIKDDYDEINNDIPTPLDPSEVEELPWCTICNEDASIRCTDCDGDLFCQNCFAEYHNDDEDYRHHKTKIFKACSVTK